MLTFLADYQAHVAERATKNIPPMPLSAKQTATLVDILKNTNLLETLTSADQALLLSLFTHRVPPGVDEASYIKASFLTSVAQQDSQTALISPEKAVELLGTMLGGYNVSPLIQFLDHPVFAPLATQALSHTLLMFDAYHDVIEKMHQGNVFAKQVVSSWAKAEWFIAKPALPEKIMVTVFKVSGETNTDDLSPATEAWTRPDIPLHANAMLMNRMPDALAKIAELKQQTHLPIAYVGDIVGTGSSRKSAINSLLWHIGHDIPYVPNKRQGGVILGSKIAPIFFNTAQDSGALPIEVDTSAFNMGDVICIYPYQGKITRENGDLIATFVLRPLTLPDEFRACGRIPLIIGRALTDKACEVLQVKPSALFIRPQLFPETESNNQKKGFTLAQKMVGKACGVDGIRPGTYCEPRMSAVGSQDTTGPMTRDELKELACLGFSADLVMQSFCHTVAYPKPTDIKTHHELPDFFASRGGVVLRPGDGIIHSWLNRMLLPDKVGTGGDSHTRFPLGISFPGGSGIVAFGAALGVMPLDMPESVLVRFKNTLQPGITLRDIVNAIPYVALQKGLLTLDSQHKKNVFSGRILEIEGLPDLKVEQAFELSDASAERSSNGCTIKLNPVPIIEYLQSNISLLTYLIKNGYQSERTLRRRIDDMKAFIQQPILLEADHNAEYAEIIEIDLANLTEPLLACPNDPDNIKPLSAVSGSHVDEVFIGSCMTNIGHYRAAGKMLKAYGKQVPTVLWIAPPTKMDARQLSEEGYYAIFGEAGARIEMPGCSLCMGNQARVKEGATVVSTSTRNFPNRMGKNANVYLCSAELAAITAILGRLPSLQEYHEKMKTMNPFASDIYRYLQFDQLADYN